MPIQINPQSIASRETPKLADLLGPIRSGQQTHRAVLEAHLATARGEVARGAYIRLFDEAARQQADQWDARQRAGQPSPPLAGLVLSVKDLFDVAGHPATAGSAWLDGRHSAVDDLPAALTPDAPAVARLRQAGALVVGHGNCTEFAFSGVGLNPHHGHPRNPVTALLDPHARITGGSTSGGALAVACGAAHAALGSDTGGSIRIPAALCGLVGFKSTQAAVPLSRSIPLSTTLDTACALAGDVGAARLLHEVLTGTRLSPQAPPLAGRRLAVPEDVMLDTLAPPVARAFDDALRRLSAAGAQIDLVRWPVLSDGAALQARFSFAAVEAHAWHRPHLAAQRARYDPRVLSRIERGAGVLADDYLALHQARQRWIATLARLLDGYDAALSPTVPMTAPELAPLIDDDDVFFSTNAALLRNPALVNLLDGCAISLPCQDPGEAPVGLMAWAPGGRDDALLGLASRLEAALQPTPRGEA